MFSRISFKYIKKLYLQPSCQRAFVIARYVDTVPVSIEDRCEYHGRLKKWLFKLESLQNKIKQQIKMCFDSVFCNMQHRFHIPLWCATWSHIVKIFIFISDSIYHPMNCEKMQSFLEVLKTFNLAAILVHYLHQSFLGLEWVVTQLRNTWLQAWLISLVLPLLI